MIHEMDVRCDGNAISKSLPTGISLTSFHWAVSPSAPRQTSSNSKQLDKPGWEEIRLTTRFRWGLLIHLFWANTWFSGSEYRIVHIVSLFATNYLPWIFSKRKSEKNLLKLHRCAKPGRVLPVPVPSQQTEARKNLVHLRLCRVSISRSAIPRCFATT